MTQHPRWARNLTSSCDGRARVGDSLPWNRPLFTSQLRLLTTLHYNRSRCSSQGGFVLKSHHAAAISDVSRRPFETPNLHASRFGQRTSWARVIRRMGCRSTLGVPIQASGSAGTRFTGRVHLDRTVYWAGSGGTTPHVSVMSRIAGTMGPKLPFATRERECPARSDRQIGRG